MAELVYALCALISILCTWFLLRGYARSHYRLLLWSGLCFAILSINNIVLLSSMVIAGNIVDLSTERRILTLVAMLPLLYGMIWEIE